MADLKEWFRKMERLGEADIPMEIDGEIITPREYMEKKGLI